MPDRYRLTESPSPSYAARTEQNVLDADGTLLITRGPARGGSALTRALALRHRRPFLHVDLNRPPPPGGWPVAIRAWAGGAAIRDLNVAGPRESRCPGIARDVCALIGAVLDQPARG